MKTFTPEFQAELIKGRTDSNALIDVYEWYDYDAVPGDDGLDPADALETFSSVEITWNGIAYRRELKSRSDIVKSITEKTNSVTLTFSNISRYMATLHQTQQIEGLVMVIRTIAPLVTNDSDSTVWRCGKPSDIDKRTFILEARQDFGNINVTAPPRKFVADDPLGRLPSDPEFEGIVFHQVNGTYAYPFVQPSNSIGGRILGRRETVTKNEQYSSADNTAYGSVIPEVFGRCQMPLIPLTSLDKGIFLTALWAVCNGPISAVTNIKTRAAGLSDPICSFANPPAPASVHLGDLGGTGTNQGNTCQADIGGGQVFSHLAYVEGAIVPTEYFQNASLSDPNVLNELPLVTALVLGRKVPVPDGDGEYTLEACSSNPVHISRFILTEFVGLNPGFMDDPVNYQTGLRCDFPVLDDSEFVVIDAVDAPLAGTTFTRYPSTGLINTRSILVGELADTEDGPYIPHNPNDPPDPLFCPVGQHRDPATGECVANTTGLNALQPQLRKRATANFSITSEVRAVDLLFKTVFPTAGLFLRVGKTGKYQILDEHASDNTRLRSATAAGATSIPVLDATPWKSGPELLTGRLLLGVGLETAEVRNVTSADYSTSGNSITLTTAVTGSVTATASGATLSGGSTSAQASGTVTIGGSPAGTVAITIDGKTISYLANADDTLETIAEMLSAYINATQRLAQYISAEYAGAVVTIKCKHGALNVDSPFLKAHGGPIADPVTAPTIAAAASGSLQAGTYQVAYADVNANGLTALTLLATVTLLADQKINVSSLPAFPAGVTSRQFFVSEKPDSPRLRYHSTRANASDFSIDSLPGTAMPPSSNTTAEEAIRVAMSFATNSQDVFPAWRPNSLVSLTTFDGGPNVFLPTVLNGHKYQVTTAGTTGASEPTWPTTAGGTVASGTAVFTEIGSTVLQQAGLTRANVLKDTFHGSISDGSNVNQVKGSFRSAKDDWALTPYRVNDRDHQLKVHKEYPIEFDGSAIDNFNQFYRRANAILAQHREGGTGIKLETGPQGLVLEEGDPICASDDAEGMVNLVARIKELRIKPNHEVVITYANRYSTHMYSDDVGSHVIPIASTLRYVMTLDSIAEFIDSPPLRDEDGLTPGFYIAVSRDLGLEGDWRGWELYADYGDGYKKIAQGDVAATLGTATTTLGAPSESSVLDTANSVTFTLKYEQPDSPFTTVTEQELLSDPRKNLFFVGNEFVQAKTIVSNGNRSYTISDLLRGRFGTNTTELTHGASERVVFINGAETLVEIDPARLHGAFDYKVKTTNQDLADVTAESFTWTGGTVKTLKPASLRGGRDSDNNLLALWNRRGRMGAGMRPYSDVPLSEETEEYLFEVPDAVPPRSWRVITGGSLAALLSSTPLGIGWEGSTSITVNTLAALGLGQVARARSLQEITQTGNYIEATLSSDGGSAGFGLISTAGDWSSAIQNSRADYYVELGYEGGSDWYLKFYVNGAEVFSETTTQGINEAGIRIRITLSGSEVRFTKNWTGTGTPPQYVSPVAPSFPLMVLAEVNNDPSASESKVEKIMMTMYPQPATIYTEAQQTLDGLTPGDPVTIRVAQISAIIGQGEFAEATI